MTDSGKTVGIVTERDPVKQVCAKDLLSSKTPLTVYHVLSSYYYQQKFVSRRSCSDYD